VSLLASGISTATNSTPLSISVAMKARFFAPGQRGPRKTKDWFERARLVIVAARERAAETTQQRVVPSMKRFPTVLQRRRLAERLSANS
jgi:hypothetical protein